MFSKLIRYGTIALAIAGVVSTVQLVQIIRAADSVAMPAPPVAPPEKTAADTVAASGILEAMSENVSIGVPESGLITEVFVKVDDTVKQGAPLLKLDDRLLQAQLVAQRAGLLAAEANIGVQKAELAKARDTYQRIEAVKDSRAISQDELRNRVNDVAIAEAQVKAQEAAVASSKALIQQTELLMERMTVRAPRAGSIIQVNIRAGEYAAPTNSRAPLLLGDLERLQVRADVDEQSASRIRVGMPAQCFLKGDAQQAIPLEFVRIEPYVIPKVSLTGAANERVDTRVLQVIYSLKKPPGRFIYVGQQVDCYIDATVKK